VVQYIEHRRKRRRKRELHNNNYRDNANAVDADFVVKSDISDEVTVTKANYDSYGDTSSADPVTQAAAASHSYSSSSAELLDCMGGGGGRGDGGGGGGVRCHTFDCRISGLRANESAVIRFRSRVWNSTLTRVYEPSAKVVLIQTTASIIIPETLDIYQSMLENDVTSGLLVAFPRISQGAGGGVPLWIILVSVAVGLVVVTLIATALWKLGFFRRNRLPDDVMMSAKITSNNGGGGGLGVYHDHEDEYVS